ncbi:hypothetical protein PITCH_A1740060 [uncultured Desulfobacterium sp.]|uniref:Uncharacterized protein n=1 Tax=uncultured Desulfobacterium sp. TaxID=201089 RepID=A0A445MV73_9BACT|nr:hypothetical protein PITCH_A1740060 [uncultured Desulfobacterium sp.]
MGWVKTDIGLSFIIGVEELENGAKPKRLSENDVFFQNQGVQSGHWRG